MELRKDYILDRWVIISEGRGKRPKQFAKKEFQEQVKDCFFCPGNEGLTPTEIGRREKDGKWYIRWFPNKFAAVGKGNPEIRTDNNYFTFADAVGSHEVIVETPSHNLQLWDLNKDEFKEVLKVYSERIVELSKNNKYALVFKNHGRDAGTSLVHSHTQVIAYNLLPRHVMEKVNAMKNYDHCPYCDIINIEKRSFRRVFENDTMVAFCPYASRFNYQVNVYPKNHIRSIVDMNEKELDDLAETMNYVLSKLRELGASYNFFLHYAPPAEDFHFQIEIIPRIANWAGFEFSSDTIINSVPPESAAAFYRGEDG